jgi:hypothetical protein
MEAMMCYPLGVLFILFLAVVSSPVSAADVTLPKKAPTHAAPPQTGCVRWVEQTWSWYNDCGPIHYPPRFRYESYAW